MPEPEGAKRQVIEVQETFASKFESWYRTDDPYSSTFTYGRMKAERFIEDALDTVPPGGRFLDVGCGTGFQVARLRDRGFDVVGLEPGVELRRRAQANNPGVPIEDGDIERMHFESESFDGVLAIEVIRHVPNPGLAVREVARVLKPGGVGILTAAPLWSLNGYSLMNQVTSRVRIPTFTKQRMSFLSQGGARDLLLAAGFSSVEMHGVLLGPWQVVGRISPKLLSKSLRAFERIDDSLSDRGAFRGLTNQLVLIARK